MKFKDTYVNKEHRFSVGQETGSGKYYISIPVSNQRVDYEEYYEISKEIHDQCPDNIDELVKLVNKCKKHEMDEKLIIKPGKDRGVG